MKIGSKEPENRQKNHYGTLPSEGIMTMHLNNLSFGFICLSFKFFRHLFDFSPRQDARPDIALGSKVQKYARNLLESHRQLNPKLRLIRPGNLVLVGIDLNFFSAYIDC